MKMVMSGATGFIGSALLRELYATDPGPHEVACLTRSPGRAAGALAQFPGARAIPWPADGAKGEALREALTGADALLHLAGEPVVGVRLTQAQKEAAWASRVDTTKLLVSAMERSAAPPGVFVCGSAVGYYGTRLDAETLVETSPAGDDPLARLCVAWESAAAEATAIEGVRVVRARIGIVLGRGGGALAKMALPIRFFVGGKLASGTQIVSWIHLTDITRALLFCIRESTVDGPINLTAPSPVDNRTLTEAIGKKLRRPTALPVPKLALRALFGDGAEPLVTGQRAIPQKLLGLGFTFRYPDLPSALDEALS